MALALSRVVGVSRLGQPDSVRLSGRLDGVPNVEHAKFSPTDLLTARRREWAYTVKSFVVPPESDEQKFWHEVRAHPLWGPPLSLTPSFKRTGQTRLCPTIRGS